MKLEFREVNRDLFEAIRDGRKKIETRAGGKGYEKIRPGDAVELACGGDSFSRRIAGIKRFPDIVALLSEYDPKEINPACSSAKEIEEIYSSFPGYKERLEKYGLLVFRLE